jgi:hypothetical protein
VNALPRSSSEERRPLERSFVQIMRLLAALVSFVCVLGSESAHADSYSYGGKGRRFELEVFLLKPADILAALVSNGCGNQHDVDINR